MKIGKVEPTMERIWKILEKDIWLMIIHSYVKLWKNLRIAPDKLKELGKILEKTCGLGPTQKKHRWTIKKKRLRRLN